ncbi:hypothetical protein [Nonomuraea sp. NPDC050783]|uniref:hypothetical protein n=1 Tax=Nonomuraea sp. NPDC050783 TaxID=3154634 RepID=UPI003467AC82
MDTARTKIATRTARWLSMGGLGLHFQALEECGSAARRVAKEISDLVAGYPATATDSTIFGRLADSSGLAGAVDSVENEVDAELGSARGKLEGVERALDKVRQNVRTAEVAGGADA